MRTARWNLIPILVVIAAAGFPVDEAHAIGVGRESVGNCTHLHVSAKPKVNAQTAPYETIRNKVASCAPSNETVTLTQHMSGSFAQSGPSIRRWIITMRPGASVTKIQHILYNCCGTYTVTDKVVSAGRVLAQSQTSFTFA
jgi:hypothetical protein